MNFLTSNVRNNIKVIFLALILALAVGQADAQYYVPWKGASNQPPGCFTGQPGCDAPFNTSSIAQVKKGGLWLNTDDQTGDSSVGLVVGGSAHIGLAPLDDDEPSAQLEVKSSSKGFLPPRITNTSKISSPAIGLLIYNTTANQYQYYDGSSWQSLGGAPPKTVALYYGTPAELTALGATIWQKCDGTNNTPKLDGVTMTGDNVAAITVYYICKL